MEGNSNSTPHFWSPAPKVPSFPAPSPSSGIRPWVLVLLASIFLILFIPSFLSSNFRGLRPSFVMNGWESLNLALIVFAILCGLLSRDVSSGGGECSEEGKGPAQPPPLQSKEWAAYSPALEQSAYEYNRPSGIRRMRSSSSYPDLRQDFHAGNDWGIVENWRFNDDIQLYRRQRSYIRELGSLDDPEVKLIQIDSMELKKSLTTSPPETPPASSPPSIFEAVAATLQPPPPVPPHARQPPPPPPPPPAVYQEEKMKGHRKRGGAAAKDVATAIALFYNKKKRMNKTKKIHDDESLRATSTPPPPPPPPPSSSIFSQIFTHRKGGSKCKRFNTIPTIQYSPPPPPPPPPAFRRSKKVNLLFPDPPLRRSLPIQPPLPPPLPPPPPSLTSPRPPRRKRIKRPTFLQTYPIAPPSPLPPPPPPPPGDDNGSYGKPTGEGAASPFCPSPDVNNKAEMFIKRFHAGLMLEKQNSIRQKKRRQQEPPDERLPEAGIELDMEQEIMTMMMGYGELADE